MTDRTMYHITPEPLFLGNLAAACGSQVRAPEDSAARIEALAERLRNASFAVEKTPVPDAGYEAWRVLPMDADALRRAKEAWLAPGLEALKRAAAAIGIEDFARRSAALAEIRRLAMDRNADMACTGSGHDVQGDVLDDAIRDLRPGTEYWIAPDALRIY